MLVSGLSNNRVILRYPQMGYQSATITYGSESYIASKYPAHIDSDPNLTNNTEWVVASWLNYMQSIVEAIEATLGPRFIGEFENLKTMLNKISLDKTFSGANAGKAILFRYMTISFTGSSIQNVLTSNIQLPVAFKPNSLTVFAYWSANTYNITNLHNGPLWVMARCYGYLTTNVRVELGARKHDGNKVASSFPSGNIEVMIVYGDGK